MTTEQKAEYLIPATCMDALREKIEKLNKKAAKLGQASIVLTVLEPPAVKKFKDDLTGVEYERVFHRCTVTGEAPKIAGWTLVAVLEPQDNGEMVVREVPGQTCPKGFFTTDLTCDHCNSKRRRNNIFVLRDEGEYHKQVGRQCLADFLGHQSPESMLAYAEMMADFRKNLSDAEDEGYGFGGKRERVADLRHFVAVCSVLIRRVGWQSRTSAREESGGTATANSAWDICTRPNEKEVREFVERKKIHANDEDGAVAEKALEWARAIPKEMAESSYLHDLGVICRQEVVNFKNAGYAASVLNAYHRHLSDQQAKIVKAQNNANKKHVGTLGERQDFANVKLVVLRPIGGMYPKSLAKFSDPDGNMLVWFASGCPQWLKVGDTYTITGTVEKHEAYNGEPQTVLKRVVPHEQPAPTGA